MTVTATYIIRGGIEGRERLRLLARVMRPTTLDLFRRVGLRRGMTCLDVGCGGGDVTVELARVVAPDGIAVGSDIDEIKLEMARAEAIEQQVFNVEFTIADASGKPDGRQFDVMYARFLLTHLPDPASTLANMVQAVRPGGIVIVEDIDFTGSFCYPRSAGYDRYVELYTQSVARRGADPNIGPRLPGMLVDAGCQRVDMNVIQPAAITGEAKVVSPLTMENIADAVRLEGLADDAEIEALVSELYELAADTRTVMSLPRVVQAWGYRPYA
jgi:SAM-dependent methyltransferase